MNKTLTTILILSGVGIIVYLLLKRSGSPIISGPKVTGTTGSASPIESFYGGLRNILTPTIGQAAVDNTGAYIQAGASALKALPGVVDSFKGLFSGWGSSTPSWSAGDDGGNLSYSPNIPGWQTDNGME